MIATEPGPLSRTTPIPLRPTGVASATIVFAIKVFSTQKKKNTRNSFLVFTDNRPFSRSLLQPYLKTPVSALADRLGQEVVFLLQREMDHTALGRIQNTECERDSVFPYLICGKLCHRVKLGLASLSEAVGVDDKPVRAVKLAAHRLKEEHFKGVQQFAVLSQSNV